MPGAVLRCAVTAVEAWAQDQLVARERRGHVEALRDRELLRWVGRARFVTAEVLAQRFGVSVRRANSRVSLLTAAGLLQCQRECGGQRRAVFLSGAGAEALGLPRRRAPRPELQRAHELAIAHLVTAIELDRPGAAVYAERECRTLERDGSMRYSVDLFEPGRGRSRRWPDVVVEIEGVRSAIEIEIAPKTTERIERIVTGYVVSDAFGAVRFLVASAALARRLAVVCRKTGGGAFAGTRLLLAPWPGADDAEIARIEAVLRGVRGG